MHLLAAQAGTISDGTEAMDLGQSPADVVVLSAADTELAALANALGAWEGAPVSLRLANLLRLGHHMSVDLYIEQVIEHARLVVVRLLGGRSYWPYGIEQIVGDLECLADGRANEGRFAERCVDDLSGKSGAQSAGSRGWHAVLLD